MKTGIPYLLSPEDARPPTEPYPATFNGSRVTALVDPPAFFGALAAALHRTGKSPDREFIYLAGHVINLARPDDPLRLPGKKGRRPMIDLLIEKSRQGVDVRVLPWISWSLAKAGRLHAVPESADNIRTIERLRQEPHMEGKACLNVIGHPAGAAHFKLIVIGGPGWAVGFTGGMDLSPDRKLPNWLDVQAQVEGPAVQGLYDFFCQVWEQNMLLGASEVIGSNGSTGSNVSNGSNKSNESNGLNKSNKSNGLNKSNMSNGSNVSNGSNKSNGSNMSNVSNGFPGRGWGGLLQGKRVTHFEFEGRFVQAVPPETSPTPARRMPYEPVGSHIVQSLRIMPRFNFAPSPLFAYVNVPPIIAAPKGIFEARRALRKAILAARRYIYIEDQYLWSQEALSWINQALRQNPDLRVIMVTGQSKQLGDRLNWYRARAVLDGLLPGLSDAERCRVRMYQGKRMVHSKTVLVDDAWALIGSANLARRSFYTDVEHAVAVYAPDGEFGRVYRTRLWAARLGIPPEDEVWLEDLDQALSLWDADWGHPWQGQVPVFPFRPLPLDPPPERTEIDEEWYAMVDDPDSRHPWRLPLRKEYPQL